ncbi:MAG: alpha/beta hydrolase [Nonomuraea sp.]|nr:alpha/beta hydrolase [Nonomuraea sp.]
MTKEHDVRRIEVDGAHVPYRVTGTGRPLVLVHGTNAGALTWDGVAAEFADVRTVVLPDLSGSDAARDDGGELTVELLAGQVAAVIADLGQGPADVVGHSLGAPVVAALAALRPDLVRGAVLVAGWAGPGDERLRHALTVWRDLAGDGDTFARYSMVMAFGREFLASIGREAVAEMATSFRPDPGRLRQIDLDLRVDVRDLLPRIQAPALVIGCARDALIDVDHSRELAAAIPGASYAELDCGHIAMAERQEEFVKLVRDFVLTSR